jgi:hypothetical protein
MSALLRKFIAEALAEIQDPRVPNQLIPSKGSSKQSKKKEEETEEMEEMAVVANIAGFTGPLGASSEDMGRNPTAPGKKLKKSKKGFVRWK